MFLLGLVVGIISSNNQMADPELLNIIRQGKDTWNSWRSGNPEPAPNLRGANLSGLDLAGFDLHDADLRNACLRHVSLTGANLEGANLRDADLAGADLSAIATGLKADQLGGTDLTATSLPETLAKTFQDLSLVKDISESAQKLFVAVLAACLYSWLTIGTTSDLNLVTNRATSALPVIQTSIPIVGFYFIAPLLLLLTFFYFHFYLQKLWEELGSLPAIFADGLPLQSKADPWLLNDLVRSHIAKLRVNRPFMSYAQQWISIFLAWWVVPITLIVFWARYLRRHDLYGTTLQSIVIVVAIAGAFFFYKLAGRTLYGMDRQEFRWRTIVTARRSYAVFGVVVLFLLLVLAISLGVINGTRSRTWDNTWWKTTHGVGTIIPHTMQSMGYSPFADLRGKEVSVKPPNWDAKLDPDDHSVTGAQLNDVDLRQADLTSAFLANAVLNHAHLEEANLLSADLTHAQLIDTHLEGADLLGANLREVQARGIRLADADLTLANLSGAKLASADLSGAILTGATLSQADLTYANLQNAKVDADQLKDAQHVELAYLSDDLQRALAFSADHNTVVRNSENKEQIDPQDAESDELARLDSLSGLPGGDAVADSLRVTITKFRTPVLALPPSTSKSSRSYTVSQIMHLYDFPDLEGQGQTIGIIELGGGFGQSDLAAYFKKMNLPEPEVVSKSVDKGQNSPSNANSADGEVQLNIEVAGTVAPKAKIVVYFTVNTDQGYIDAVKAAIDDTQNHPSVIVTGWGGPERNWTQRALQAFDKELHRAADAGITFVAGSGDSGTTDGVADGTSHVDFPASSQWVLAVGGTSLQADGTNIRSEVVWNSLANFTGATGTGNSSVFPQPDWQKATSQLSKSGRSIPDVSANADPNTGYEASIDGQGTVIGGSSAAAPLWAGLVALLNQGLGKNIGHFNPVLYSKIGPTDAFNPIPRGIGIQSQPGWTPQSGWGTPDGKKLLAALRKLQ
jgi:uncharacterized protein YjbI with pentapeptide repeats